MVRALHDGHLTREHLHERLILLHRRHTSAQATTAASRGVRYAPRTSRYQSSDTPFTAPCSHTDAAQSTIQKRTRSQNHYNPGFDGRLTRRLAQRLVADAEVMTIRAVARRHGVSWPVINALVRAWAGCVAEHRRSRRCSVLLVDETSMRKRHRYVTVIVNADTNKTLAMIEHRSSAALSAFLMSQPHKWRRGVKVVVTDGSRAYKASVDACLPHARHVLDRFHVIRWFCAGLTQVRRDIQRRPEGSKPAFDPEVFRARFALLRRGDTLTNIDRSRLDTLFDTHPRLRAGWQALQQLHGLYLADDHDGALEALGRFCDLYQTGELPEYHDTHTGGALSVGLGLTLSTTGPSGAFTMICRPGPAGGTRTDRSGGRDLIGALS